MLITEVVFLKKIYLVRHGKAEGQAFESPLTEKGVKQASDLVTFFDNIIVERIISSPYKRAIQTIKPLAEKLNIKIEINSQLKERILSTEPLPDWRANLKETFENPYMTFAGGESSEEATRRMVEVVEGVFKSKLSNTVLVTHGNVMALLLKYYNKQFGFNEWAKLSNPDIYRLSLDSLGVTFERVWHAVTEFE